MARTLTLPPRASVRKEDTWDLGSLFGSDAQWEKGLAKWETMLPGYARFKGKLGRSADTLAKCLEFDRESDLLGERLGNYAYLRCAEDQGSSPSQRMKGRFTMVAAKFSEASAWMRPEILAIPAKKLAQMLKSPRLAEWRLAIERVVRYRPHTLETKGEEILAMQGPMSEASNQVFRQLTDADFKWGAVENEEGERVEVSHSTFQSLLYSPKRSVRQAAFHEYYRQYEGHRNAIAAAYNASVQRDVYYAKVRNYPSALEAALFPDRVPVAVYDNLVASVHRGLPAVHRYLALRKRVLKLKEIHHYDTYVPLLSDIKKQHTWEQAVDTIMEALRPLGEEYGHVLREGLTSGRWCDRYPNKGKQSGAFSSGGYTGSPFILTNYRTDVLDQVFTLAHEAGHSMHSWFSSKNQPYQYYNYTIFVAEVASTFNEQLLLQHLLRHAADKRERAYLLNHAIDEIRGTIVRQTMFAEFERVSHALVEKGEPLTVDLLRKEYRKLLELYFGKGFTVDPQLELECLRIPHFYRAFYVYKYATGLSAAIALSQRVLGGGKPELADYLGFLKGGCSKYPLDVLRGAGVDMERPAPVNAAMQRFASLVDELEKLL
jgi:oligoendopeptidase F